LAWVVRMGTAMSLGIVIELVQPYFHRGMEFPDVIANAAGIATGALAVLALRGIRAGFRRLPPNTPLPEAAIAMGPGGAFAAAGEAQMFIPGSVPPPGE